MMRIIPVQAIALVALAGRVPAGNGETPADFLHSLANSRSTIIASTGNEPNELKPLPDVRPLRGVDRQHVLAFLGTPDNCAAQTQTQCAQLKEWSFAFFYLPRGWRGGGPSLNLQFNNRGVVQDAKWTFSR